MGKYPNVAIERNVPARMRDGVTLYADIYRPESASPLPVILMRLPYDKTAAENVGHIHPLWYARQGYLVVVQDTRGRGMSEGEFYPFISEAADGYDTIEWASGLPGSNGKVGMYGFSYVGAAQMLAAVMQPPHVPRARVRLGRLLRPLDVSGRGALSGVQHVLGSESGDGDCAPARQSCT